MKKTTVNIQTISLVIVLLFAVTFEANSQMRKVVSRTTSTSNATFKGCSATLGNKTGEVFSVAPGILKARATSKSVTVKVKKTGGRAETQVNIYVNGALRRAKKIEFDNGNYSTQYKKRVLNNVKGKMIKVEIVNQSVANTFKYNAKIEGFNKSIVKGGNAPIKGILPGQIKKSIETIGSCTGKTRVIIRRQSGQARGTIRVYEKRGSGWSSTAIKSVTFERNETKKIFVVNSNKKLKIELKNISVGNMLGYKMNALAIQ